ncbi:MAG: hypothetical protein KGV44_01205 [Flavobacteriaceae bacterium]|nr:hypothetical protein [Flavobacteriaceae bacterium]
MKKMFQIIALMLLVVSCSKNEEQELGNVKVKFTNKTGFTIQNLVISGKTIGTLNKGNTTEYIHFKTFGFDSGMPDVDCKGKIEGKTIEGIDKFYFCGTEKSKVEEGTYEINIILVSLNGKQYFQLNTSKTDSDDISLNSSDLQGKWEWISSYGGIGGTTSTPKSTGVRQSIHIGRDIICFYKSDNPISAMTFTIETKKSIYDHKERPIMVLFGGFDKSFEIKGDILTLYDEVYDGFTHHYKRTKHPARGCTKEYKHLIVKVKDEKGNPIALDKMKVTRLDTNEDITSHFVGNEWNVYQKWGSYPFYSDDFVEKDKDKSLTINFKGYIKENKVIDTDVVVSADDCHVLYIRGKTDFVLD